MSEMTVSLITFVGDMSCYVWWRVMQSGMLCAPV